MDRRDLRTSLTNTIGKREVLGFASGPSEAESFSKGFLRSLADRGLRDVKLVISDDHKGLRSAAGKEFHATQQRCRVHWMRNALAHVGPKQRPAVVAMLSSGDQSFEVYSFKPNGVNKRAEECLALCGLRNETWPTSRF